MTTLEDSCYLGSVWAIQGFFPLKVAVRKWPSLASVTLWSVTFSIQTVFCFVLFLLLTCFSSFQLSEKILIR